MAYVIVYLAIALFAAVAVYVGEGKRGWRSVLACIGLGLIWPLTTLGVILGILMKDKNR